MAGIASLEASDLRLILAPEALHILQRLFEDKVEVALGAYFDRKKFANLSPYAVQWTKLPEDWGAADLAQPSFTITKQLEPVSYPFPEGIDLSERRHWFCRLRKNKLLRSNRVDTYTYIGTVVGKTAEGTGRTLSAAIREAELKFCAEQAGIEDV